MPYTWLTTDNEMTIFYYPQNNNMNNGYIIDDLKNKMERFYYSFTVIVNAILLYYGYDIINTDIAGKLENNRLIY